jgi:hypothetical protein
MTVKRCSNPDCESGGKFLPLTSFHKNSHASSGYHGYCKDCRNPVNRLKTAEWYRKNKGPRVRATRNAWYAKNHDKVRAYQKAYRDRQKAKAAT